MKSLDFPNIFEEAFANRLKTREYDGVADEIVTEKWYKLSFEDAKCFIDDQEWIEHIIEPKNQLSKSWIKLITHEYKNTKTGAIRRYSYTSVRPYVQGYGCDGTTDLNIHAIANRLAEQQGLDYPALWRKAYPFYFYAKFDFSLFTDDVVLAETLIPQKIDADVALRDLEAINNYTLAMEFGIALHEIGAISTDWAETRRNLEMLKTQIEIETHDWFEKHSQSLG